MTPCVPTCLHNFVSLPPIQVRTPLEHVHLLASLPSLRSSIPTPPEAAPPPPTLLHGAAGFSHQAGEAPVYRSSRLHAINPTAAVNEDTSYLYTLASDAGLAPAALLC